MIKKIYKVIIVPYTLLLLYLMLLGFGRTQFDDNIIRLTPFFSTLMFIENTIRLQTIITIILGNIVMFIPYGFLGWIFPKIEDPTTLVFHFLSAIIIVEALQYFTRMGIFEVDDIILNTSGVCIGYFVKRLLERRFSAFIF
ncbi:VanZ family protein [Chryseobacterium sp. MYb264]|uniref:VanZ family protein n=1 Tax=Chryseobacterium sp. MYb264 TaxID=2745153 RepID=UPI002E1356A1|nr:VanZ family protein [Chryseobacterium sp. MYb264]